MTKGLKRYQFAGDLHFVTFSCFGRRPYLGSPEACSRFEEALERVRSRFKFYVIGYVVMPEHVHLLVSEPAKHLLSTVMHALKLSVSKLSREHPFWHSRYYDFNVFATRKQIEKLRYLHRNPVSRGLVARPEEWPWSSFRHYATGQRGIVQIESFWTESERHGRLLVPAPADMHYVAAAPTLTDSQRPRIGEGGAPTGHHTEPGAPPPVCSKWP